MADLSRTSKRILVYLIALALILCQSAVLSQSFVYGLSDESVSAEAAYELEDTAVSEDGGVTAGAAAEGDYSVLAFTSDTHNKDGNVAANRLGGWLDIMSDRYDGIDAMAFGGDMANASASQSAFWTLTQADMDQLNERGITGVYTTGNHEYSPGAYTYGRNSTTENYVENAQGYEGSNYRIYCLGSSAYSEYDNSGGSWSQNGWNEYTEKQIKILSDYLDSVDNDKVIIIITHYPLHFNGSRTIKNADKVIEVLNNAVAGDPDDSADDKKIVYLWGHNHTDSDQHYDQIYMPDKSLTYSNGNTADIDFYYGAAGCMSDSEYGTGSASVKGKGLILTINDKNELSFTYYDANGKNVTEDTNGNASNKTISEQEAEAVTAVSIKDPAAASVEVGKLLKLSAKVEPRAATNREVSWSSSDPTVAKVDSTGKVRGLKAGEAVITVESADGGFTDSYNITVAPNNATKYVLTDTFEAGKNYIIANKDSDEAYALKNNNGAVMATDVTVIDDVIYNDDDSIVFTADGNDTSVSSLENGEYYLSVNTSSGWYSSTSLGLNKTKPANYSWKYSGDNKLTVTSDSSTYYLYYTTGSSTYTVSTSASSTSPREVYLFEEIREQVPVSGVTVSPTTESVEVGRTKQLTATVAPSNATNKKVTWSSDKTGVATVDEKTGRVTGVSEGDATITATTADGGKTATCKVTVTPRTGSDPEYVIYSDGYALSIERSKNTAQGGSSSYKYTGLAGVAYESGDAADESIRWIFEATTGGYYIKSLDGKYLNATYISGSNSGTGDLKLDDTKDIWVLESGYSLENGTVNGSKLKSTNASGTASSDKFLSYEDGQNLFSVRSEGYADGVNIETASDPVAVTSVTVAPTAISVEAGKTVQLTATVIPSGATNKKVTWASKDTNKATVDENGKVKGVAEGEVEIIATTVDGGKTATCTVTVTPNTSTEDYYVIVVDGYALSKDASTDELVNSGSSSQRYYYHGLEGVRYSEGDSSDNILWTLEPVDNTGKKYYIKNAEGKYLSATYESNSTSGSTGELTVGDTRDVWTIDGTLDSWKVDGSMLQSANSTKYLALETGNNNTKFFTVRSEGNADKTTLKEGTAQDPTPDDPTPDDPTPTPDPDPTGKVEYVQATSFEDGKEYVIANGNTGDVYVVSNVATGSGDNAGLKGIKATVENGKLKLSSDDEAKAAFTAEVKTSKSGSNSAWLRNGTGTYLYTASSNGLRISTEQTETTTSSSGQPKDNKEKYWHYNATDHLLWYFLDTASSDGYTDNSGTYKYWLEYSGTSSVTFKANHTGNNTSGSSKNSAISDFDTPDIYLFVKTEGGSVDPTPDPTPDDPTPTPGPMPTPDDPTPTPTPEPGSDPTQMGEDGTPVGPGASAAAADKAITSMTVDTDLPGSEFYKLTLRSPKQTSTSIKLNWTAANGAVKYVVYGNKCGKGIKPQKLTTVTGNTLTLKNVAGQKFKKGKYYKVMVVALNAKNEVVSTSKLIHVATKGGKVGNDKSVKVSKSVIKKAKSLKAGKSLKLKAKAVAQSKKLKVKKHVAVRYESTNPAIAKVSKSGKVTAKSAGTCYVYAYAQDGVFKKIKVTVK